LLFALVAFAGVPTWAQGVRTAPPTEQAASGKADQAEGARILSEFRQAQIGGDYWLSFELRVMPRQGAERTLTGALIGTPGVHGPLSRITAGEGTWLVESGPQPSAWTLEQGVAVAAPPGQALADTGITVFDLQMPFLYWKDFVYEGPARVRGRPTSSFVLRPPAGQPVPVPELTGVRVLIDVQFQAMVQAEELGQDGTVLKSISLLDLKKVGDQWLVKELDVRDHRTRSKTRFSVRAAALGLNWPADTFTPAGLAAPLPRVPGEKVVRF
jgi:hypothetical protein